MRKSNFSAQVAWPNDECRLPIAEYLKDTFRLSVWHTSSIQLQTSPHMDINRSIARVRQQIEFFPDVDVDVDGYVDAVRCALTLRQKHPRNAKI